jgi:hypothetical protein
VWPYVLPHEHNKIGVSLLDLWPSCICIKKDHELWDGDANLVSRVEEKMLEAMLKDGMIGRVKSQTLELKAQDFNRTR